MSEKENGGHKPEDDKLAGYQLTDLEHKFCTPTREEFNLLEIFPEVDAFIISIKDEQVRDVVEDEIKYYRNHVGTSGDILTAIGTIINVEVEGTFSKFSKENRVSPEFQMLKNKFKRLSEAHSVGFAEVMAEASRGSREFEDGQERRRQKEREGSSILPRLGVNGTFQTPDGAIKGVVESGAQVGGPYVIKTSTGRVKVSKISKAEYE